MHEVMISFLSLSTILLYVLGGVLQWMNIKRRPIPKKAVLMVVLFGIVTHGTCLMYYISTPAGVVLNFFTVSMLCGWAVVFIVLISSLKKPIENIFAILLPGLAMSILLSWIFRGPQDVLKHLTPGVIAHIIFSILAYSLLAIAALHAWLLAYQDYKLRHHAAGDVIKAFPPLETMESLLFELIEGGVLLLACSIISGFLFFDELRMRHISHATYLSIISWVIFVALLLGRYRWGWRGNIAICGTFVGFIILVCSYFGSKMLADFSW